MTVTPAKFDGDPLWRAYEREIAQLLRDMEPGGKVRHDVTVQGRMSLSGRQLDAIAEGQIFSRAINVAIECKRLTKPIGVAAIDAFVGKLLDIGFGMGIMYSSSGFTTPALNRAAEARNPGGSFKTRMRRF